MKMEPKDRKLIFNWNTLGNELVFADEPTIGVAGIAPQMHDDFGYILAERWNANADLQRQLAAERERADKLEWLAKERLAELTEIYRPHRRRSEGGEAATLPAFYGD